MIDLREHRRFNVKSGSFALLRTTSIELSKISDMSMGEIGFAVIKSRPVKMGQIINISLDGLAFDYIESNGDHVEVFKMDILFAENAFYLGRLLFKTIFDYEIHPKIPFNTFTIRRCGVQFGELTYRQRSLLEYFICNHTVNQVPIRPGFRGHEHSSLMLQNKDTAVSCAV